ncbi:MAG TPA: PepSY domain-containing protein [Actinokineospora sp.]|nr:PepSY domain-containing protein [Actinokineospora sp.]
MTENKARWAAIAAGMAGAFVAGGLAIGLISTASAQDSTTTAPDSGTTTAPADPDRPRDESKAQRTDETLLTGDDAEKAKAAALAKYPGATIQRVETDSDGVYEAHLTTPDGKRVTVEMDKSFAITGEEAGRGHK